MGPLIYIFFVKFWLFVFCLRKFSKIEGANPPANPSQVNSTPISMQYSLPLTQDLIILLTCRVIKDLTNVF